MRPNDDEIHKKGKMRSTDLLKEPVLRQFALEEIGGGKLFGLGFQLPPPLGVVHSLQVDEEDGTAAVLLPLLLADRTVLAPFGHLPVNRARRVNPPFALLDGLQRMRISIRSFGIYG